MSQTTLQGITADHILIEQDVNGGSSVGPGTVGDSVSCPSGYYVTGGGYEFSFSGSPTHGFRAWYNGPVAGWGGNGTGWSVAGDTDSAGTMRIWVLCLKLSG